MKHPKKLRFAILATGVIIQSLASTNLSAEVNMENIYQFKRLEDLAAPQRIYIHHRIQDFFKTNPNFNPEMHEFLIDAEGVIYVTEKNNEAINLESIIASPSCPGSD
jgi:hypothetical protein